MSLFSPFDSNETNVADGADDDAEVRQATIEGQYDPTVPKKINGKEWWIERVDSVSGELETYAGAWPRAMVENAQYEPEQPIWMGCSERTGREFGVEFSRAFRHIAYLGSTGTGKTTAIYNSATQLMMGGHGVAIVDPKGDDIYDLLRRVPKSRREDVVYVDLGADYYSLEDPETGEDVPYQIGFNILDTYHDPGEPGFDEEIEWIVADLIELLAAGEYWGPRMNRIAKNMIRGMARHEEEFTIIEIYYALLEEGNRRQYADLIGDSIDDDDIMFLEGFTRRIAEELSDDELDPLLGRLKDWVENPITRKIIAMRGAEVTLGQIVNEQKILIANNDLPKEAKEMVANAVVSGIWTAVTSRKDPSEQQMMELAGVDDAGSEYAPFFLAIDECHSVLTDGDEIETMLMEARSKKLGLMLSTQVLRSLPDEAADAIISNCNTILSLTPNHPQEAREIANRFGGMDVEDLQRTPDYHAQTQLNSEDDPFLAKLIPPYPPRHTIEEAYELILTSLENYGSPVQSGREILDEMHFDAGGSVSNSAGGAADVESADGMAPSVEAVDAVLEDDDRKRQALKAVYDAGIREGDGPTSEPIPIGQVTQRYAERFGLSGTQASNLVERLENAGLLASERDDQLILVEITGKGRSAIGLDTGSGGSGGKYTHRYLLRRLYTAFTRVGYDVDLPTQDGDELPDAVARLPFDTADVSLSEGNRLLREEYPTINALSGDRALHIEAESKGISKPGGPIKNATKYDGPIMFAVADGGSDGFANNARRLADIFMSPPFTSGRCPSDATRKFYTKNPLPVEPIDPSDASAGTKYAVCPNPDARLEWVELKDGEIVARTSAGDTVVSYEDADALAARSIEDFEAFYYYDDDRDVYVVARRGEDGELHERKYASKSVMRENVTLLYSPVVPELAFDDGVPTLREVAEEWLFAIVPNDESDPITMYRPDPSGGEPELVPLCEYLARILPDDVDAPTIGTVDNGDIASAVESDMQEDSPETSTDPDPMPDSPAEPDHAEENENRNNGSDDGATGIRDRLRELEGGD